MKKKLAILSLAIGMSAPSFAEGVYGLVDFGQGKLELDALGGTFSKTDTAMDVGLGFDLNSNFAIELAYRKLGKIKQTDSWGDYITTDTKSIQASVVGKLNVNETIDFFGRVGYARLDVDGYDSYYDESGTDSANKALFGLGVDFKTTDKLSIRLEIVRYAEWDGATFSSMTAGLKYQF